MAGMVQYVCIGKQHLDYPLHLYGDKNPNFISMRVYHGGFFTQPPKRNYILGEQSNFQGVKVKEMTPKMLSAMHKSLGYDGRGLCSVCWEDWVGVDHMDYHLIHLHCQEDIDRWRHKWLPSKQKYILNFFIDPEPDLIHIFYPQTLRSAPSCVLSQKLTELIHRNPTANEDEATAFFLKKYDVWIPGKVVVVSLVEAKKKFATVYGIST